MINIVTMISFAKIMAFYCLVLLGLSLILFVELNDKSFYEKKKHAIYKTTEKSVSPRRYLIDSPSCKIPNLNPYDRSILKNVWRKNHTDCFTHPALTEIIYDPKTEETFLKIKNSSLKFYTEEETVYCCIIAIQESYKPIMLSKPTCVNISNNGSLPLNQKLQLLMVSCYDSENGHIYENVHATVVKAKGIKRKPRIKNKLNVLLIGLDSVSRLNLYRTMPQTVTYLHTHSWVEMLGYTKVADNTLPNLMALLTGISPDKLRAPHRMFFDGYPFIWKEFAAHGYVTAYVEDDPYMGTFNCHLRGFSRKPTDYYPLAFFTVADRVVNLGSDKDCFGYKSPSDHVFDYLVDFTRAHESDPFFGLFWVNHFSHNNLNQPSSEDAQLLKTLQKLENQGTLNTTMVVFLSDHGLRVGQHRHTKIGWFEDRLPFLFVSLPEWYKTENEKDYTNLFRNGDKLTSPFDVYKTLSHVLFGRDLKDPLGCKTCHSLLMDIPKNRSCSEAGVSPHWCACHDLEDLHTSKHWGKLVVSAINRRVEREIDIVEGYICARLMLTKVLYVRKKVNLAEYVVGVQTAPGGAEFEGTVLTKGDLQIVADSVSRLNDYGTESHCARNPRMKKLCYCIDVGFS